MSSLAVVVDWSCPVVDGALVERMLGAGVHQPGDGCTVRTSRHAALGFAKHVTLPDDREGDQPCGDPDQDLWVVADCRIDNGPELRDELRRLGMDRIASGALGNAHLADARLLLEGYRCWGPELAGRLAGDFAFVIWDGRGRLLYAARDPFGARPLFFHATGTRLVLANEVSHLLASGSVSDRLDDRAVCDQLLGSFRCRRETFFSDISRLRPGHLLLADGNRWCERRYWYPPQAPVWGRSRADCLDEFRQIFRRAVCDRLAADRPIVLHLSGGLDTSSIVTMAVTIEGQVEPRTGRIHLAAARYPGLDCDDTPRIQAVADRVPFPLHWWNGIECEGTELLHRAFTPVPAVAHDRDLDGDLRIGLEMGARVIVAGYGGDELLYERGVFRDLAARGKWLQLLREANQVATRSTSLGYWIHDAMTNAIPPFLRRGYRWIRPRQPAPLAPWLGPRLRDLWNDWPSEDQSLTWHSHTQAATWTWLTHAPLVWDLEELYLLGGRHGLQHRFPFLDRRLADFVLGLPYHERLPGGRMKAFLREAMANLLPPEVGQRRQTAEFTSARRWQWQRDVPAIRQVLEGGHDWLCAPYVIREEARKLFERLIRQPQDTVDIEGCCTTWAIVMLELWLRGLARFNAAA